MTGVVINARFLTQRVSGVQRFARELLTALDRRLAEDSGLASRFGHVTALYPAGNAIIDLPAWSTIRVQPLRGGGGHVWEQFALARACKGKVLVSLCGAGPLLHKDQLLIIHDANIFDQPDAFSWRYRLFHRHMRRRLAGRVTALGTVSKAAAVALSPHLRVPPDRFAIIPNSADHILSVQPDPEALGRYGLEVGRYLLTVGNQSPNKNIARLVAAHAALENPPVLVVAGAQAPGLTSETLTPNDGVRLLGRVSDGVLRSLYEGALGFVWPARSEGFGIPPLEAMALGVPVLSSCTTAMPEVLGDAALYFDPDNTADMTATLAGFLRMSAADRAGMIAKGRARARVFSWDASVDRLIVALDGQLWKYAAPRRDSARSTASGAAEAST